jgi:hypothetical protein
MPTVADGKAFVTTVDEITFDNPRIPPNLVKGREGWFLAPDGKTLQDYFIETDGQVQRWSEIGQNVWVNTAPVQPRELAQLGISGALSAQHTMIKVVTEEDGVETHHITRISRIGHANIQNTLIYARVTNARREQMGQTLRYTWK